MEQLELDVDLPAPERPLGIVTVCHLCGAATAPIPVDGGASAPWGPAALWGYVALKAHLRDQHPEHA